MSDFWFGAIVGFAAWPVAIVLFKLMGGKIRGPLLYHCECGCVINLGLNPEAKSCLSCGREIAVETFKP